MDAFDPNIVRTYSQDELLKKLNSRWNTQYTNNENNEFFQSNDYLNALFSNRFPNIPLNEFREINREFKDMKDDLYLDTEILLKDRSVSVYDITDISFLRGGSVVVTLKNGKKEEVYTRNGSDREPMSINDIQKINFTRPGVEEYYTSHREEYPWIQKLNSFFELYPTRNYRSSLVKALDIAENIYRELELNASRLRAIVNEYRRFHKECGYQLCQETYRNS